ncbi:MAG: hypothetical protein V3V20_10590 [Algisphaera sp.]
MSEDDDLYELAEPNDEPTPPPPPAAARPMDSAGSAERRPTGDLNDIELTETVDHSPPTAEKRPAKLSASENDASSDSHASSSAASGPMSVSPAKARLAREDQRKRAALEQAEDDARKQKRLFIIAGIAVGLIVLIGLYLKLT